MSPDREYYVRSLAEAILFGDGDRRQVPVLPSEVTDAKVAIEMRGMVSAIRRELHFQHADLAKRIADELAAQCTPDAIAAAITAAVAREVENLPTEIGRIARDRVRDIARKAFDEKIRDQVEKAAMEHASKVFGAIWHEVWADPKPEGGG